MNNKIIITKIILETRKAIKTSGWSRKYFAINEKNSSVLPTDSTAKKYSFNGALLYAITKVLSGNDDTIIVSNLTINTIYNSIMSAVRAILGYDIISHWNNMPDTKLNQLDELFDILLSRLSVNVIHTSSVDSTDNNTNAMATTA